MKLYGIPNCDTVKKARTWLNDAGLAYDWHDFKKNGVSAELLQGWIAQAGWEKLVNKAGTTWRKLSDAEKAAVVDADSAIALMLAQPSVIKRPVLDSNGTISVGFSTDRYEALLK
ncbi:transcriptional regulator, Spx/MgsR family [Andreprevotia lacus DSM 23236]|jgi:arsenate reductase|uniref:Transcriptional regulator, Spx/MgsR family n=1 Tax=Andreprevotia lacus DSM 23236 TaxID=1121001 RepID=A0A1W1X6E7_9NEIS|nr:ArsC family reductase [Andreprevotia lacus]SMC19393.1 transcriptional regulator, Spx/MgsR family [Andreprevotia lacus DSM 23236]